MRHFISTGASPSSALSAASARNDATSDRGDAEGVLPARPRGADDTDEEAGLLSEEPPVAMTSRAVPVAAAAAQWARLDYKVI